MSIFAKVAYYNKKQRTRARERAKVKGGDITKPQGYAYAK